MSDFDVCVIGHVTRDHSNISQEPRPGGTAYYSALALRRLGRDVAVVTRIAPEDQGDLLGEMREAGIHIVALDSAATSVFANTYDEVDPNLRSQRVLSLADAFEPADLGSVEARAYHLGPLTREDMNAEFIEAVAERGPVSLDCQGLVREVLDGVVKACPCAEAPRILRHLAIAKADEGEARILTRAHVAERSAPALVELGARMALVTRGSEGSVVATSAEIEVIGALYCDEPRDPTGCGDTYAAAFLHRWLEGEAPRDAGRFAAAASTLALERFGAFASTEARVEERTRAVS